MKSEPGLVELVAYYALKQDASILSRGEITQALRGRLPAYMVPSYLEELPFIPMTISNKADHRRLPKPKRPRLSAGTKLVAAKTEGEHLLTRVLAEVLKVDHVSTEDHFFDDLGANSLLMARFCARIRQHPDMSNVSMRDIYLNPTVAKLAERLRHGADEAVTVAKPEPFHVPSDLAYYGCGALQLLFYAACSLLGLWFFDAGLEWIYAAIGSPPEVYLRSVAFAFGSFVVLTAVPVIAKWALIGRWKPEAIPIWSLRYFRFWAVKTLVRSAPVVVFSGSPIYNLYLRLLGARIGSNVVVDCRFVPVCTDLIAIGDNTILRKDSILLGYRAQANFIHTGPIEIGSNAFVGEASVLDIRTAMGNDTQLGHASSLQSGQRIPDGKRYHGSPAQETTSDYCPIENAPCSMLRRELVDAVQLLGLFAIAIPVPILLLTYWEHYSAEVAGGALAAIDLTSAMLLVSAGSFLGSLAAGLLAVFIVPRICQLFLETDKTYSLYGFHYRLQTLISQFSNSRFLNLLFGDSSAIVHYMRLVGWTLNEVEQTGSNFGTNQQHDNPFLCDIGSGTMVSDGLSMINMYQSSSSFRLARTSIGDHNYLGNNIHYPPDGRTGANCLLGTKVMIPIDGPMRENVGLLGSPCFEIPRIVDRDKTLIGALSAETRRQRLRQKNLYNLVTASLFLFAQWLLFFATLVVWQLALLHYPRYGVFALFAAAAVMSGGAILFFMFLERASLGFRQLKPKMVTIYDPYFWFHERHWKLSDSPVVRLFVGTPFKNLISRLAGVKIGRKVYDGGSIMTDRTLVEIADYANLNEASVLQAHSLEEGVFKSDHVRIGKGCSLGPAAFVHYGVTMGDHSVLDANSFLMKGEVLDPHTVWCGNPAKLHRRNVASDRIITSPPSQEMTDQIRSEGGGGITQRPMRGSRSYEKPIDFEIASSHSSAGMVFCQLIRPIGPLNGLRKSIGIRHGPLFEGVPRAIAQRGRGHEGDEHGQPERRDEQQRKLLHRPRKNVHSVGRVASLREPCHGLGAAETYCRGGNCERLKDRIDRYQIANESNPYQPRGSNREGVPSDVRPEDGEHGARQEEGTQPEEVEVVQGADLELTENRCCTPSDAEDESAHNDARAAPSTAENEHQCKDRIEPKLVGQAPERLVDCRSHRIRKCAGNDLF